jgi:hypothetical protein
MTATAFDPVRIADIVMATLFEHARTAEDENDDEDSSLALLLDVYVTDRKKALHFILCWHADESIARVIVGMAKRSGARTGNAVLVVEIHDMDAAHLRPNVPLSEQVLHRVVAFQAGPWVNALVAALVRENPRLAAA